MHYILSLVLITSVSTQSFAVEGPQYVRPDHGAKATAKPTVPSARPAAPPAKELTAEEIIAQLPKPAVTGSAANVAEVEASLRYPKFIEYMNARIKNAAARIPDPRARAFFGKMNFLDLYKFWTKTTPMSATQMIQSLAILEVEGMSIFGERRKSACDRACAYACNAKEGHAEISYTRQVVGAAERSSYHQFKDAGDTLYVNENEAITRQAGSKLWPQARECLNMYRQSPGHWEALQEYQDIACHDMKPVKGYKCISVFGEFAPLDGRWH